MTQYRHCKYKLFLRSRGTIAIDLPSKEQLEKMILKACEYVSLTVGIAIFNENDGNFYKAKGREVAQTRLTPTLFRLHYLTIGNDKLEFRLSSFIKVDRDLYNVVLILYYGSDGSKVYIRDGYIEMGDEDENA